MTKKKHVDYELEEERLKYTIDYIEKTINTTDYHKDLYKGNIKQAMTELDYLDSSLTYINVLVNTKFLEVAEKNYDSYKKSKAKPYFARIKYKAKGEEKTHNIYIGKTTLMRAEDNELLIVDWRAPVANIYYEGRLGETSYETDNGVEEGELLLKRQFTIDKGKLENIIDIDITTTDAFLQASLDANAESKLKDIASTIQGEQNKVIRASLNKPLIVQGVAGSGKTTIALHRIAFFIYTYEETFEPESFLILAPNNLFINYISEVLPELGVERVQQSTYVDFVGDLIVNKFKTTDSDDKIMHLINKNLKDNEFVIWSSAFKGSMEFKDITDKYMLEIEEDFVPDLDFIFEDEILFSMEAIKKMFLVDLVYHPFYKRINEIKKSLDNKLKAVKKDKLSEIQDFYDKQIEDARDDIDNADERRIVITDLIETRDVRLKQMTNVIKTTTKKFLLNFPKKTLNQYYAELFTEDNILRLSNGTIDPEKIAYLCEYSTQLFKKKKVEMEDYAALGYLKYKIFGFEKKIEVKSVVIDEAQDYSLFQLYTLKTIINTSRFTLLGDLSQGIHSYRSINTWEGVVEKIFGVEESNFMTLEQSYRTTIEVMQLANEIIKKLNSESIVLAKPVIRHGKPAEHKEFTKDEDLIVSLEDTIVKMKSAKYKSIAVICKTEDECKSVKKHMEASGNIKSRILDEKQMQYEAGVILVPVHLAKGLEFDVVFIVNLEESYMEEELDFKLLYVCMTRTLHRLFIYNKEGKIPMLKGINHLKENN